VFAASHRTGRGPTRKQLFLGFNLPATTFRKRLRAHVSRLTELVYAFRFEAPVESALRTCDNDKPNCRAIRAGVMPALEAARMAFSCPRVKEISASIIFVDEGLSVGKNRLPLCSASASVAASRRSSSSLLRCLTAPGRSLGRTCRGLGEEETEFDAALSWIGSRPIRHDAVTKLKRQVEVPAERAGVATYPRFGERSPSRRTSGGLPNQPAPC
jgi:hypothetical protein